MQEEKSYQRYILLLKISAITVLLGRAWQFLFLDAPYRTFFWDEALLEPVVTLFNMTWQEWATNETVDQNIQLSIILTGIIYLIGATSVFFLNKNQRWVIPTLWICTFFLFILAILQTKEKFYHIGQFFEHASQVGVIVVLIGSIQGWLIGKRLEFTIKSLVALTFFCHGLYAINYYPRPGVFVDLMLNTFHTSENFAHLFIFIIGVIDLVIAFALFIPKIDKIALWYAVIWGIITAISRLTANIYWDFFLSSFQQSIHLMVYRLVHGLLPLSLLVLHGIKPWKRQVCHSPEQHEFQNELI